MIIKWESTFCSFVVFVFVVVDTTSAEEWKTILATKNCVGGTLEMCALDMEQVRENRSKREREEGWESEGKKEWESESIGKEEVKRQTAAIERRREGGREKEKETRTR